MRFVMNPLTQLLDVAALTGSSPPSGFSWTEVTTPTQAITAGNAYLINYSGTTTLSLPATCKVGDTFAVVGNIGGFIITQAAGQQMVGGTYASTPGVSGNATSMNTGVSVGFLATNTSSSSVWRIYFLIPDLQLN